MTMDISQSDFNSLIELIKSWPGVTVTDYSFEGRVLSPFFASSELPEQLISKIYEQFPQLKHSLTIRKVRVEDSTLIGNQ